MEQPRESEKSGALLAEFVVKLNLRTCPIEASPDYHELGHVSKVSRDLQVNEASVNARTTAPLQTRAAG